MVILANTKGVRRIRNYQVPKFKRFIESQFGLNFKSLRFKETKNSPEFCLNFNSKYLFVCLLVSRLNRNFMVWKL